MSELDDKIEMRSIEGATPHTMILLKQLTEIQTQFLTLSSLVNKLQLEIVEIKKVLGI